MNDLEAAKDLWRKLEDLLEDRGCFNHVQTSTDMAEIRAEMFKAIMENT